MASVFSAVFVLLYVGHLLGDHWLQTGHQADNKDRKDRTGRIACAGHVLSLTACKAVCLIPSAFMLDLRLSVWGVLIGFAVDSGTHYWADRRFTLRSLAALVNKDGYWDYCTVVRKSGEKERVTGPGTGSFHLDQSWHVWWMGVAAMVIALTSTAH